MLFTTGVAVAASTFAGGMILSATDVSSASSSFETRLSATELDLIFGKDRPAKVGPHPIIYMTADEAKQIKGKNPVAIGFAIGAIGGGIVGGATAYDNGTSIGYGIAIGAISGGVGGAMIPLGGGGAAGAIFSGSLGGAAGGLTGLALGGSSGMCLGCHQLKK